MNNLFTPPVWTLIVVTGSILCAATMAALFVHLRGRKRIEVCAQTPQPRVAAAHVVAHTAPGAPSARALPDYPALLEQRNRAKLAARGADRAPRRPGVAARWKSQNRVMTGV